MQTSNALAGTAGSELPRAGDTRKSELQRLNSRFENLNDVASDLIARLDNLADRTLGPVPQDAEKSDGVEGSPHCAVAQIDAQLNRLERTLSMAGVITDRLEQIA